MSLLSRALCRPAESLTFLLSLIAASALMTGCSTLSFGPSGQTLVPSAIPYTEIDRRQFIDLGFTIRTNQGVLVSVEASKTDTLIWMEQEVNGRFRNAFLRRKNMVYVLGIRGDYVESSSTQSTLYSLIMHAWRNAQPKHTASSDYGCSSRLCIQ